MTLTDHLYAGPWFLLEIEELLLRSYKTIPARIRPDEQMVGHTGFLVFARAADREPEPLPGATAAPDTSPARRPAVDGADDDRVDSGMDSGMYSDRAPEDLSDSSGDAGDDLTF